MTAVSITGKLASRANGRKFRGFSRRAAGLAICLTLTGANVGSSRREPANVILVVIDALRADHLGHSGYSRKTSPFLDELAAKSVRFENTVSQSSWTKTSVASLFTSRYPEAHGVRRAQDVLPDATRTLAEALQDRGYRTFAIHGNPWLEERFGFDQGFDEFLFTHWYKDTFDAGKVNRRALRWLDEGAKEPFFLYLHYMDVHSPWRPPESFDRFGPRAMDKYDGSILYVDSRLRELHAALAERGLTENTWVVVTADHGEEFGEHGNTKIGHGRTLYREVLQVPLIFHHRHHRKDPTGKIVRRQVRLIDVAPTILALLGIRAPEEMDGVSLRADVMGAGDASEVDLEAFSQVGFSAAARDRDLVSLTTSKFRYIFDYESGAEELYDQISDPGGTEDLASRNAATAREFRERVLRYRTIEAAKRLGDASHAEIDADIERQLRALGYLK